MNVNIQEIMEQLAKSMKANDTKTTAKLQKRLDAALGIVTVDEDQGGAEAWERSRR